MALLSKKEKVELATLIANAVVTALKENSTNSQPSAKGRKSSNEGTSSAMQKKTSTKKSKTSKLTIADFEPKGSKTEEGYMNWNSYNSQRTKYCYYVATNGEVTDAKVFGTPWYGKVDYSENSKYYKAKAEFNKKYHYIKVEDRK